MKKLIVIACAAIVLMTAISCKNPNQSPTDKVGGYHTSMVRVEKVVG